MKKLLHIFCGAALCGSLFAAAEWQEDFSKGATMKENGWFTNQFNAKDKVELKDGVMTFHCASDPYKGTRYVKRIPLFRQGELSFDIKVNTENSTNYNHLSMTVYLYDTFIICGHGGPRTLQRFHGGVENNKNLAKIKNNEWYRFKMRYDLDKRTAEYFVNDMENPVFTDEDIKLDPNRVGNSTISLFNYALPSGTIVNCIRNLKLKSLENEKAAKTVWTEDFSKGPTFEDNGYKPDGKPDPADKAEFKDGDLTFQCAKGIGSRFIKKVPYIRKGQFSFYWKLNMKRAPGFNHLNMIMRFYNMHLYINGGAGAIMRYNGGKKDDKRLSQLKNNTWYRVCIKFDMDKKRVEYYINDMRTPVLVDEDFVFPADVAEKPTFMIGNYGKSNGTFANCVRNIELKEILSDEAAEEKPVKKEGAVILHGYCSEFYRIAELIRTSGDGKVQNFFLTSDNSSETPRNILQFEKMPGFSGKNIPRLIVLCDIPAGKILPERVLRQIESSVNKGSVLLVLGGYFTLNRGQFGGTILEKMLPVQCGKPFETRFFDPAAALQDDSGATVSAIQLVKVKDDAEVKTKAGDIPFVVEGSYGKGKIFVVTGIPCGRQGDYAGSEQWTNSLGNMLKNAI